MLQLTGFAAIAQPQQRQAAMAAAPAGATVSALSALAAKVPASAPVEPAAPASGLGSEPLVQAPAVPASDAVPTREGPAAVATTHATARPPLDLKSLESRLRETQAIGVFTKLALKNQVDDLLDRFRAYHQGQRVSSLPELRQAFNMLMLKVLALLQDKDPPLADAFVASREPLWDILSRPQTLPEVGRTKGGAS